MKLNTGIIAGIAGLGAVVAGGFAASKTEKGQKVMNSVGSKFVKKGQALKSKGAILKGEAEVAVSEEN